MDSSPNPIERMRIAVRDLEAFADALEEGHAARDAYAQIIATLIDCEEDAFGPRPRSRRGDGAKRRLLAYLQENVGAVVHGRALAAVSGIQEWPRRIRELRVEDGYDIAELGGRSRYCLVSPHPDQGRAEQWRTANQIRKRKGSGKSRIEAFLEVNVGQIVKREQLDYVSRIAEGSRRVRELRDESGWPIDSHIDDPELTPGQYRLLSTDPADRRDVSQRLYPDDLRARVFARDGYTCQDCGRDRTVALAEGDARFYLEVHHKVAIADELAKMSLKELNDIANLLTLCHRDHVRRTAALQREKREARRKDRRA